MGRIRYTHNSFSIGILSKKIHGNTEFEGYNNSLDECENFQIQPTGGTFKRGGTKFVSQIKGDNAVLILFCYSSSEQYMCEFGDHYIRFYTKYGKLVDDNSKHVEIETPFSIESAKNIKTFQSGNILYLVTDIGIYSLKRTSTTSFKLANKPITYSAEPLTIMNSEKIALKPSATQGSITLVAVDPSDSSKKPDAKFAPIFFDSDKGHSLVLTYSVYNENAGYYEDKHIYLVIESVEDDTDGFKKIIAKLDAGLTNNPTELYNTDPVTKWRVGAFTSDRGMPKASAMYEGRLFLANNLSYPTGIWGSGKLYNDWTDFYTGTNDADAVQFKVNAQFADEILWAVGQSKLFFGTRWGIYIAGSASFNDEAITPSNFRCRLFESVGASSIQPVVALDAVFFVDVSGRGVHEIRLSSETGSYEVSDISLLADDLLKSGIVSHAWQQTPVKTYWCAVNDGFLCALTYLKNNGIMAWSKHVLGGSNVKVENIAIMHGDKHDLLWMIVRREINGKFVRYIEYMQASYDPLTQEEFKQFYIDSGVTKEKKAKIKDITKQSDAYVTFNNSSVVNRYKQLYASMPAENRKFFIAYFHVHPTDTNYTYRIINNKFFLFNNGGVVDSSLSGSDNQLFVYATTVKSIQESSSSSGNTTLELIDSRHINVGDMISITRDNTTYKEYVTVKRKSGNRISVNTKQVIAGDEIYITFGNFESYHKGTKSQITLSDYTFSQEEISSNELQQVYFNKINGSTQLNGKVLRYKAISQDSMRIYNRDQDTEYDMESISPFDTVDPAGNAYFYFDTVEGLKHLAGQTVSVCYNGNSGDDVIVPDNGVIRTPRPVMFANIGLKYKAFFKTVPFAGGSIIGSSVGAVGGQKSMWLHLYYSLAGKYGDSANRLYDIPYTRLLTTFDNDKSLISGLVKCPMVSSGDVYNRCVYIEHDKPVSFNILSITQDIEVSDS